MVGTAHLLAFIAAFAGASLPAASAAASDWVWPVRGEILTTYLNGDDPYAGGQHRGIDIASVEGSPVVAAAGGSVRHAGVAGSSGLTVSIRSADGRFDVSYLHLLAVEVRKGDVVAAGQRVGAVGTSGGRSAAAPHLHFGVREAGSRHAYRDPLGLLPPAPVVEAPRGAPVPVGAPVRVAPSPRAVRGPRRVPSPARPPHVVRPVPVPQGRRIPMVVRRPGNRVGAPAPELARALAPTLAPAPAPAPAPALAPARPGLGVAPRPLPVTVMDGPMVVRRPEPSTAGRGNRGGLDLGWALACGGILAALGLLHRRSAPRRGSVRLRGEAAADRSLAGRMPPVLDGR